MKGIRLPALAAVAAFTAFLPALWCGFVEWDDPLMVLNNFHFQGFTLENLRWMLTAFHSWHYHPLTWFSYALDYSLWGMNPFGYHLTNLLLHAGNAALVFMLARRLLASDLAAFAASLAFGIHPLRAESVAWVTERRGLLSAFFLLASLLTYLDKRRGLSLGAYALSLLSKAMGVTFPAVLLILDVYQGRRDWQRMLKEKLPYAALALAAVVVGLRAQGTGGVLRPFEDYGLMMRAAVSCYGLAFYVVKTVLPINLIPLYLMPPVHDPFESRFVLAGISVLALTAFLVQQRKQRPWLWQAFAVYAVVLVPVLGLAPYGPQLAADRYTYLACLPIAFLAGAAIERWKPLRPWTAAAGALLLVLSWQQSRIWKDTWSLWSHTARADAGHWAARNFLGNQLRAQGKLEEALALYREAVALNPRYAAGHNNLGTALSARGQDEEALRHYEEAALLEPRHPAIHYNAAVSLAKLGRPKEAVEALRAELKNDPDSARARAALNVLERRGY